MGAKVETLDKVQEKPNMGKIDFRNSHYQEKCFGKKKKRFCARLSPRLTLREKDTSDQNINRIMTCRIRIPKVHHFR